MFTFAIEQSLEEAFSSYPRSVKPALSRPNRHGGGDFQCNSVLALAGKLGENPKTLAETVAARLRDNLSPGVCDVSVSGPGFINFTLSDGFIAGAARARSAHVVTAKVPETVVIDFGGPNIAKALHVGHLRSFVIGESLRRILSAVGHRVVSDIHYGDWGLPIGKLVLGIVESGADAMSSGTWTLDELGAFYRTGNERAKADGAAYAKAKDITLRLQAGDPGLRELWSRIRKVSLEGISAHISMLGAHFDTLDGESDVDPLIPAMLERLENAGLAVESEGALVGPVVDDGSLPPVLLRKSDGSALYGTTDLATVMARIAKYRPNTIVYCVDGRQDIHLRTCFMLAAKASGAGVAGFSPLPRLVHAAFGTVNGPDGSPYSTRDGSPALLGDLVSEAVARASEGLSDDPGGATARMMAVAALKFADLSTDRRPGYVFDAERMMSFTGRTGPYVQYAVVRVRSLLAKAADDGGVPPGDISVADPADRALALEVLGLPAAVLRAAEELQPKHVCDSAYGIASALSRLYADADILRAPPDVRAGRLALVRWAGDALVTALDLLGIEAPERM